MENEKPRLAMTGMGKMRCDSAWAGLTPEQRDTLESWLKIARSKFEYDAATSCLLHKLKIDEVMENMALTDQQQIQQVREELFGPDLPD